MQRGAGAPAGFLAAALAGLDQLAHLRAGQFNLHDRSVSLSGEAIDAEAADALKAALVAAAPAAFAVETRLTGAAPPVAAAPSATAPSAPASAPVPSDAAQAPAPGAGTAPPLAAKDCEARLAEIVHATPILFKTASSGSGPKSFAVLDAVVAAAKQCPAAAFEIAGHTDDIGQPQDNRLLSQQRAWAVASYLVRAGIDEGRLSAVGFGDTKPVAPNDSEEDRAKNRRIEFNLK